jgi:hypothetical protein
LASACLPLVRRWSRNGSGWLVLSRFGRGGRRGGICVGRGFPVASRAARMSCVDRGEVPEWPMGPVSKTDRRNATNPVPAASSDLPVPAACRPLVRGLHGGWPLLWLSSPVPVVPVPGRVPAVCPLCLFVSPCPYCGCACCPYCPVFRARHRLAVWACRSHSPQSLPVQGGQATQTGPLAPVPSPAVLGSAAPTQDGLTRRVRRRPLFLVQAPGLGCAVGRMAGLTDLDRWDTRWRLPPRRSIRPLCGDGPFDTSAEKTEERNASGIGCRQTS